MKTKAQQTSLQNLRIIRNTVSLLAILLVSVITTAQPKKEKRGMKERNEFSVEQKNQLLLKKLTLELDLNEVQQKEMSAIITDKIAKRESHKAEMKARMEKGEKPTNDERFAMKIKMLDDEIATKKRIEKILNAKQFEKWTSLKENHKGNRHEKQRGKHKDERQS